MILTILGQYNRGDSYYDDPEEDNSGKISALEELLATKLAEYLDSTFSYALAKLSSATQAHLYKGPSKRKSLQFFL